MSTSILLALRDLSFHYPGGVPVLDRVGLELVGGETLGIIGPSGGGKSTLLKVVAGLLPPTGGEITRPADTEIGMTFQRAGLFDSLSCGENIAFPLRERLGLRGDAVVERVQRALAEVGLEGIEDKRTHELSGGMQKRLGIARALVLAPQLLLYDDPTAGLDPLTSRAIAQLIGQVKKKYGTTVIVVTSDLDVALQLSDRIGFLWRGTLKDTGPASSLYKTALPEVRQFVRGELVGPLTREERP